MARGSTALLTGSATSASCKSPGWKPKRRRTLLLTSLSRCLAVGGVERQDLRVRRLSCRLIADRLSEHPGIKFKWLWMSELDFGEIGVSRVQENVPLAADHSGGNEQRRSLTTSNPLISESVQRFVACFVPVCRKG